jgi:release factor glutamine methyltransferase
MNSIITDNSVKTLKSYLQDHLTKIYDDREAQNIVAALFQHNFQWSRADLVVKENQRISESELLKFHFALKRLMKKEPLQYVLGESYFFGMTFQVEPAVLIPRPETEELVAAVIKANSMDAPTILDIGTGSGCIAIALKKNIPNAIVTAIDVSKEALVVASKNAHQNEVEIRFQELDILKSNIAGMYDIIVSNPPYIPLSDAANMSEQVLMHEPHLALFVENNDALVFYHRIFEVAKHILNKKGMLWFEIHEDKKNALTEWLQSQNGVVWQFHQDMQGKDRMLQIKFQ